MQPTHNPGAEPIDVAVLYPELMEGLTEKQTFDIRQVFAASAHEGWLPNRADVDLLARYMRGEITRDEYLAVIL